VNEPLVFLQDDKRSQPPLLVSHSFTSEGRMTSSGFRESGDRLRIARTFANRAWLSASLVAARALRAGKAADCVAAVGESRTAAVVGQALVDICQ
jgi:hypothetical protein